MELPGQGSDLTCSCDLCRSCSNTRSFKPLCPAGESNVRPGTAATALILLPTAGTPIQVAFNRMFIKGPNQNLSLPVKRTRMEWETLSTWIYLFILFIFCLFRATPMAYRRSQARGQIGAAVASLHHSHSNASSKPHLRPTPQLPAMPDP